MLSILELKSRMFFPCAFCSIYIRVCSAISLVAQFFNKRRFLKRPCLLGFTTFGGRGGIKMPLSFYLARLESDPFCQIVGSLRSGQIKMKARSASFKFI